MPDLIERRQVERHKPRLGDHRAHDAVHAGGPPAQALAVEFDLAVDKPDYGVAPGELGVLDDPARDGAVNRVQLLPVNG